MQALETPTLPGLFERWTSSVVRKARLPLALAFIIVSDFLPEGLSFYIAGLRLTLARLTFLFMAPVLVGRVANLTSTGRYRFVFSDLLVLLTGMWMFVAVTFSQGADMALAHAGPEVLEICIGYWSARVLLSEHGQAVSFAKLLCCTIGVVALLGLPDSLTGHYQIQIWVNRLTGYDKGWAEYAGIYRHGFLKAQGPIEHPIAFGLICCIGLILALSGRVPARSLVVIACGLGLFFAGESAPVIALFIGVVLLLYGRILGRIPMKWPGLMAVAAVGIMVICIVSDDPFTVIVRHLTFDPQTGYYRIWTWDLAMELLQQSPFVGVGFVEFSSQWLPSIDNMWLAFAVQYGYPGSVLLGLSILGAMSLPTSGPQVSLTAAESKLGTTLSIILCVIIIVAFTVHLWGSARILTALLVGVRAHLGALGRLPPRRQPGRFVYDLAAMTGSAEPTL